MSAEFEREERYIVFKLSDVEEHFTSGEKQQLARLAEVQRVGREEVGKPPLECVVVESDWPEYEPTWEAIEARMTGTQPAPSDEYVGWYCAHCERGVDASEVTYHEQHQACGRVITEDRPPKPAPSTPEGWLRAIDEALVVTHLGVANVSDTYEQAKAKLDSLIGFHVDVATDPAVNGGRKLMPIEPTEEIYQCFSAYDGTSYSNPFDRDEFLKDWRAALAAAPEAKP